MRLPRQPHDDVIGRHHCGAAAARLARELPEILAIIENVGRLHVVRLIQPRLDQEQVLRIADVLLQVWRHGRERFEQTGKDALVGPGNRIAAVDQIEVDGPVICIDNNLHRIANVVEVDAWGRLRRGEIGARRVGVLHPEHPPVADNEVWIMIEPEEWCDRMHPLLDITPDHDPAVGRDVA